VIPDENNVIQVSDDIFCSWFVDCLENTDKYYGKTVNFLGMATRGKELSENEVKDLVGKLKESSKQLDYDEAIVNLDKLKNIKLNDSKKEYVTDLEKALKKFDWDKVDEILNKF
jgi:uncharacterized protein YpuA (DUF1002 family)